MKEDEMKKCEVCGKLFVPDLTHAKSGRFENWDGHTWKPVCEHFTKGIVISIG